MPEARLRRTREAYKRPSIFFKSDGTLGQETDKPLVLLVHADIEVRRRLESFGGQYQQARPQADGDGRD